jgi:drug/metabolite transporter (DMT)-like permease
MRQWRVIVLALLAVLLLMAGLVLLILPVPYEGAVLHQIDPQHTIHVLDVLGGGLLAMGCAVAWLAGILWQRRMYAS